MPDTEIVDLLQGAQAALEESRPRDAIAACQHARQFYPHAITALRLLGEAYLEVGRPDDASGVFEAVLSDDPFNVLARIGLAVVAEERGDDDRALLQFRGAWEIDPLLPQLRGELVRLYRKRYGPGGHLRMTRPALAMLHSRNEDLVRAIKEFRALVHEYPDRDELALGLAEALWRRGDDRQARQLLEQLLANTPRLARALLMMADILAVQGGDPAPLLSAARIVDPNADIARTLHGVRPSAVLEAYIAAPIRVPAFDPLAAPAWDSPPDRAAAGSDAAPLLTWESIAASWTDDLAAAGHETGQTATASDTEATLFADLGRERTGEAAPWRDDAADPQPFSWKPTDDERAGVQSGEQDGAPALTDVPLDTMQPRPGEPDAITRLTADWDNIDAELEAAIPPERSAQEASIELGESGAAEPTPFRFDALLSDTGTTSQEAVAAGAGADSFAAVDGPTGTASDRTPPAEPIDLGLDSDLAPFQLEAGAAARPTAELSFSELLRRGDESISNWPADASPAASTGDHAGPPPAPAHSRSSAVARPDASVTGGELSPELSESEPSGPAAAPSGATSDVAIRAMDGVETVPVTAAEERDAGSDEPGPAPDDRPTAMFAAPAGASDSTPDEPVFGSLPSSYSDATDELPVQAAEEELPDWLRGDLFTPAEVEPPEPPIATTDGTPLDSPSRAVAAHDDALDARVATPTDAAGTPSAAVKLPERRGTGETVTPEPQAFDDADTGPLPPLPPLAGAVTPGEATSTTSPAYPVAGVAPMSSWRADWALPETDRDDAATAATSTNEQVDGVAGATTEDEAATSEAPPDAVAGHALPRWAGPSTVELGDFTRADGALAATSAEPFAESGTATAELGADGAASSAAPASQDADQPSGSGAAPEHASPEEELAAYRKQVKESDTVAPETIAALRQMIAAGVGGPRVHRVLGEAYLKLGQYDLASAELQQALRARFPR